MRSSAGLSNAASRAVLTPKQGIFAKISEYARRVAGVLGIAAGASIAATASAPVQAAPDQSALSAPASPSAPVPGNPSRSVVPELRDREWKSVVQKGIGAKDFAQAAFGTDEWGLLVDEEGNHLANPSKLRQGRYYLLARNAQDAALVSAAVKSMGGIGLAPKTSVSKGAESHRVSRIQKESAPKLSADELVSYAEEHLGKPYRFGGSGEKSIDCSQLVIESLKKAGVVDSSYDTTAAGLSKMATAKKLKDVKKGDLLFLHKRSGHIGHVAIALSEPKDGYVDIIDASSSQGAVTKRRFHTQIAGLSAGSLPFVGRTVVPDSMPVYAQADAPSATVVARAEVSAPVAPAQTAVARIETPLKMAYAAKPLAKSAPIMVASTEKRAATLPQKETPKTATLAKTAERIVSAAASMVISNANASEAPLPATALTPTQKPQRKMVAAKPAPSASNEGVRLRPETSIKTPIREASAASVETSVMKKVSAERPSAEITAFPGEKVVPVGEISRKVTERVDALVIDFASRVNDREQAASIRASLEKKSLSEQISYYRSQAAAANDPSFALEANLVATKLEIVKLHGERSLVSDNLAYYKAQADRSVPGAFETVNKLSKVASVLDAKINSMKLAANDAEYRAKMVA